MEARSRRLLPLTLGALLALVLVTGVAGILIAGRIRTGEAALRNRWLARSSALERVRSALYLSGTLARDYFADPQGPEAERWLAALARLEADSRRDLAVNPDPSIEGEVLAYWRVLDLMTGMARTRHSAGVDTYFRAQLAARRDVMLELAGNIGAAIERERRAREQDLVRMYDQFRIVLIGGLVLVILSGGALAFLTGRRLLRLELQARALAQQVVDIQENERRALARELHDEVGQSLTGLLLDAGAGRLDMVVNTAERLVEEIRRIALSLRPSMLDDLGLVPAIEWQAREVAQRSGVPVEVAAEESLDGVPDAQRTCVYRVLQEALANAVRHAGANRIRVGLKQSARAVQLRVEDNGCGFAAARTCGLGLLGMEERVAQLGGRLQVASAPGKGTVVTAELPV